MSDVSVLKFDRNLVFHILINFEKFEKRQKDKGTDRQKDKGTDRQKDRETGKQKEL